MKLFKLLRQKQFHRRVCTCIFACIFMYIHVCTMYMYIHLFTYVYQQKCTHVYLRVLTYRLTLHVIVTLHNTI